MRHKKKKPNWYKESVAWHENKRQALGLSEDEYYAERLEELLKELPEKRYGSTFVPPAPEAKTVMPATKMAVQPKTVYVGSRQQMYSAKQQQVRY